MGERGGLVGSVNDESLCYWKKVERSLSRSVLREMENDPHFTIPTKEPSHEALVKWRKSTLFLNAARRFRYTLNLDNDSSHFKKPRERVKAAGLATQAVLRFIHAAKDYSPNVHEALAKARSRGFQIDAASLAKMVGDFDTHALLSHDGALGIAAKLNVNIKRGISELDADMQRRQEIYGTNTYPEKRPKGFFVFVWEAMQDLTLMVLGFCAVVSLGVGIATEGVREGWYDGAGIGFSITLVVLVTAASDYQQSLQFRDLEAEKRKIFIQVTRNCNRKKVSIYELVVGDIVHLSIGDQVPADGLLIEGYDVIIDESSMTGESLPSRKCTEHDAFLLSGTKVMDGYGVMLVTGVGMNTEWGHLMETLGDGEVSETPLQVKLNGLATFIGKLGLVAAVLTFLVLLIRFLVKKSGAEGLLHWDGHDAIDIVNFFAIAITIIVVAVPEGLPLAVTLTLAFAMKQMMSDKALVRHLAACETMGSATTICSDKTGTLTTNQMVVVKAWVAGRLGNASSLKNGLPTAVRDILIENIFFNTSGDVANAHGELILIGSPTEMAVLGFGVNLGGNFQEVRSQCKIVKVQPFNSARKKMGVLLKSQKDGQVIERAHWKGASEIVLNMCDRVMNEEGKTIPMTEELLRELTGVITRFADGALRTLCLAYKQVEYREGSDIPDSHCVCLAIVGIKDPVRPGVSEAVALCSQAGIVVRMVTGDNLNTAQAIARECGILTDGEAVEGPDFRTWSRDEMNRRIPKLQVMARSSPTDKYKLVKALQAMGEVVAVTGDGTNDAPALHLADIGLAMGIAGTEVAKESADIIVLDDNFKTIVVVTKWGRAVYTNIQKFVQFQLTVNLVALVINFVSACVTGTAPLTAVQLLWVNLIMDTLGALALATEPPHDDLLKKPSTGRKSNFITSIMWRNILGQVVYQLIVLGLLQYKGKDIFQKYIHGDQEHQDAVLNTMIFNAFVFCQVFNEMNAREMEKFNIFAHTFDNWVFLLIVSITVIFQWIMVAYLGKFANTTPLDGYQWLITVGFGAISLLVALVTKCVPMSSTNLRRPEQHAEVNPTAYHPLPSEPLSHEV